MLCIQVGSTHCQICSAVVGGGRGEVGKVPRSANAFQVPSRNLQRESLVCQSGLDNDICAEETPRST